MKQIRLFLALSALVILFLVPVPRADAFQALFHLDMPEFNGRVRLMAVAHTAADFGTGDHELTLASPLVTQMTMPRFLAAGDHARLHLDLAPDEKQAVSIPVTAGTAPGRSIITCTIQGLVKDGEHRTLPGAP